MLDPPQMTSRIGGQGSLQATVGAWRDLPRGQAAVGGADPLIPTVFGATPFPPAEAPWTSRAAPTPPKAQSYLRPLHAPTNPPSALLTMQAARSEGDSATGQALRPNWAVPEYRCSTCKGRRLCDFIDLYYDASKRRWNRSCEVCRVYVARNTVTLAPHTAPCGWTAEPPLRNFRDALFSLRWPCCAASAAATRADSA